jgi:5-(carboxyamino)imidazole ribonucleotide synthase
MMPARPDLSAAPPVGPGRPIDAPIVGVLGGGQLGRMLALAGYPLGLRFRFLDPAPEAPVEDLAERLSGDPDDPELLERFTSGLHVVTYEFENVEVELARWLERVLPVYPPPLALEASQDRLREKALFRALGLPTAPFAPVDTQADLRRALAEVGAPAILKTRRFGYDGKGQRLIRTPEDADDAWQALGGVPLLLEGFVAFERELSQLAVRGRDGSVVFYPLVENHHQGGILRVSLAPAPGLTPGLSALAAEQTRRVLEALHYVGVLAIEYFQQGDRLIASEMAPRVHNSGHWTIEGAHTSQFENHLRAILGWPLGAAEAVAPCGMLNLIGTPPDPRAVLSVPDAHLHLYGKSPRPGRKLGHVTVCAATHEQVRERLALLEERVRAEEVRLSEDGARS